MSQTIWSTRSKILAFAAVVEIGTGIAMMIAPAFVAALLIRAEISELAVLLGRCMGIALLALLLGYVGAVAHIGGSLVWPVVALHGIVASSLV